MQLRRKLVQVGEVERLGVAYPEQMFGQVGIELLDRIEQPLHGHLQFGQRLELFIVEIDQPVQQLPLALQQLAQLRLYTPALLLGDVRGPFDGDAPVAGELAQSLAVADLPQRGVGDTLVNLGQLTSQPTQIRQLAPLFQQHLAQRAANACHLHLFARGVKHIL